MNYSGQPLKRLEDPRLVTGNGSFVDDIRLPDMLYACVLRSPYAHARLRSIDVAAAASCRVWWACSLATTSPACCPISPSRAMGGEWQADEVNAPDSLCWPRTRPVMSGNQWPSSRPESAMWPGMPWTLSRWTTNPCSPYSTRSKRRGRTRVPIHAHLGTNIALRIHHDRQGQDLDAAFARADRIIRQRYEVQRLAPVPLETRGLVAHYQPQDDSLTIWASTQAPHRVRRQLARLLNRPEDRVRVIAPDVGGGFGEKGGSSPRMRPSPTSQSSWDSPSSGWPTARKTCWGFTAGGISST